MQDSDACGQKCSCEHSAGLSIGQRIKLEDKSKYSSLTAICLIQPVAMDANPDNGLFPIIVTDIGDKREISATNEATKDALGSCAAGIPFNSRDIIPLLPSKNIIIS